MIEKMFKRVVRERKAGSMPSRISPMSKKRPSGDIPPKELHRCKYLLMFSRYCIFCALIVFCPALSIAAPILSVPESVELGRIRVNEAQRFEFKVKNVSNETLTIAEIKPSCTCTDVQIQGATTLTPGAECVVSGNVRFGGPVGNWKTSLQVTAKAQNGRTDTASVIIRGKVVAVVLTDKNHVDFGEVKMDSTTEFATIEAKAGDSQENWDSIQPVGNYEHFDVMVERHPGNLFRLLVRLDTKGLPISTVHDDVKFRLFDGTRPLPYQIDLQVTAKIVGPLNVVPVCIYLGAVSSSATIAKKVIVSSSELDLRELAIEKQPTLGLAELIKISPESVAVNVKITPGPLDKTINDNILLVHKSSGTRIKIPIFGAVKRDDGPSVRQDGSEKPSE